MAFDPFGKGHLTQLIPQLNSPFLCQMLLLEHFVDHVNDLVVLLRSFPTDFYNQRQFLAPASLLPVMYALGGFKDLVILSLHQGGLLPVLVAPFAKALALPFAKASPLPFAKALALPFAKASPLPFAKALDFFLFLLFSARPKACSRPASKPEDMGTTLDPTFLLKSLLLLVAIPFAKEALLSFVPFGKVGLLSKSPFGKVLFSGVSMSLGYP